MKDDTHRPAPRPGFSNIATVLRHRNFRLLWIGTFVSNAGDWMDQIALNWLVLQTTGSAAHLGLVNLVRAVPILALTLIGGVAADRFERRRMMMVSQSAGMVLALLLAVLVATGTAGLGPIMIVAAGRGAMIAFNQPARQTLISETVPRDSLGAAIALNSLTINLTKVIGPLLAGLLIAQFGMATCFAVNGLSFIVVIWSLALMEFPKRPARPTPEPLSQALRTGFIYLKHNRTMLFLVLVAFVPPLFGQPYLHLLALFAIDVFHVGPEGLGLMTACAAAGSMAGGLTLALVPAASRRGFVMLLMMASYGTLVCVFAVTAGFGRALLLLICIGAVQILCNATNNILLQTLVPDEVRGRVLSVLLLNKGLVPLGTAAVALLAAAIGAPWALFLSGGIVATFACAVLAFVPAIRRLRI